MDGGHVPRSLGHSPPTRPVPQGYGLQPFIYHNPPDRVVGILMVARAGIHRMTDRVGSTDLLDTWGRSPRPTRGDLSPREALPRDDRNGVTIVAGATITPQAFVKGLAD